MYSVLYVDDEPSLLEIGKIFLERSGNFRVTTMGLFLIREILALTGITIRETGVPGSGARFEILVPEGKYRLAERT